MQGGAWWVDVLVIFRAGFLESMKCAVGVILRQARVWLTFLWQLDRLVFAKHHFDLLAKHSQFVHMSQRCQVNQTERCLLTIRVHAHIHAAIQDYSRNIVIS